jgi:hypothetical protein
LIILVNAKSVNAEGIYRFDAEGGLIVGKQQTSQPKRVSVPGDNSLEFRRKAIDARHSKPALNLIFITPWDLKRTAVHYA